MGDPYRIPPLWDVTEYMKLRNAINLPEAIEKAVRDRAARGERK